MSPQVSKLSQVLAFSKKYPLSRGMVSYAVIWPIGSLVQQTINAEEKYDFAKLARFSLYGCLYVAPTLHCWIKLANRIWPLSTLRSALTKAVIEQFTYTPFAMVSFYYGMTLLEGETIEDAKNEVKAKFIPTYQVGVCVWPVLQTFNYTVIKERNRVVFASFCSLIWTSFLAYMKHLQEDEVAGGLAIKDTEVTMTTASAKKIHHIPSETSHEKSWIVGHKIDG